MPTIRPWRNGRKYKRGRPPLPPDKPIDPPKPRSNGSKRRGASLFVLITTHGMHSKQVCRRTRRSNRFIPHSDFKGVPRRSPAPLRGGHRRPFAPHHLLLRYCTSGRHGGAKRGQKAKSKQQANGHPGTTPGTPPASNYLTPSTIRKCLHPQPILKSLLSIPQASQSVIPPYVYSLLTVTSLPEFSNATSVVICNCLRTIHCNGNTLPIVPFHKGPYQHSLASFLNTSSGTFLLRFWRSNYSNLAAKQHVQRSVSNNFLGHLWDLLCNIISYINSRPLSPINKTIHSNTVLFLPQAPHHHHHHYNDLSSLESLPQFLQPRTTHNTVYPPNHLCGIACSQQCLLSNLHHQPTPTALLALPMHLNLLPLHSTLTLHVLH